MSDEVRVDIPLALAPIMYDLTNVYGFAEMRGVDPVYYELQGKTNDVHWYACTDGNPDNVMWCFYDLRFFASEDEYSAAARVEVGLGMSGDDYPFEIIMTLYEDPMGENTVRQTDTLSVENAQHWAYIMIEYIQEYINDANEITQWLLNELNGSSEEDAPLQELREANATESNAFIEAWNEVGIEVYDASDDEWILPPDNNGVFGDQAV